MYDDRKTNFQGDHFTFAIDRVDENGKVVEHLGGALNAYAAQAAFNTLLICQEPPETLLLRQGARVLRREVAVGGFREWILAGKPADWVEQRRANSDQQ